MDHLSTFQTIALILIFIGLPIAIIWATISALRYNANNAAELIARSGWKHELVKSGTVERRFSSSTRGIGWTLEFKVPEYKHDSAQLGFPSILEWHTVDAKLVNGTAIIITIPPTPPEAREFIAYDYRAILRELDIWLGSDLSPQPVGSIIFQGRYIVMATSEACAGQIVDAAEDLLLHWPEWEKSRLVYIPTPVLMADPKGIMIRISLNRLDLPSRVQPLDHPYIDRIFAVVRLGVETAAGLRDTR